MISLKPTLLLLLIAQAAGSALAQVREPVMYVNPTSMSCRDSALGGVSECTQNLDASGFYIPRENGANVTVTCYTTWKYTLKNTKQEIVTEFDPVVVDTQVAGQSFRTRMTFTRNIQSIHVASTPTSSWQCTYRY